MKPELLYSYSIESLKFKVFANKPDDKNLFYLKQIHSNAVVSPLNTNIDTSADGFISCDSTKRSYAIVTADCLPILALGRQGNAFVHAGWQGVQKNILSKKNIHIIEPHTFFVGPHIQSCCYEVSPEFRPNFPNSHAFSKKHNQIYFNLFFEIKHRILQDFPHAKIINSDECTHCNEIYHSYRRDKTTKRNWNIITF